MEFTGKPTPLPLEPQINRCLAHGHHVGEWCVKRYECACHETIKHDAGVHAPAAYRKCLSDNFAAFIPLAGWPEDGQPENQPKTEK